MNAATSEAAAAGSKPLTLKELHSRMALIRAFETRVAELYRDGEIPGFVHTSLGQEAVAVGVCARAARRRLPRHHPPRPRPLPGQGRRPRRDDGRAVRQGDRACAAARAARCTSPTRARDPRRQRDRRRRACRSRSAPGCRASCSARAASPSPSSARARSTRAPSTRRVNLAAIWDLPVLFVCENNVYAEFTDSRTMTPRARRGRARAAAYGVEADAGRRQRRRAPCSAAALDAAARCRAGDGPVPDRGRDLPLARPLRGRRPALQARGGVDRAGASATRSCVAGARGSSERGEATGERARAPPRARRARPRRARRSSAPATPPPPPSRRPTQHVFGRLSRRGQPSATSRPSTRAWPTRWRRTSASS